MGGLSISEADSMVAKTLSAVPVQFHDPGGAPAYDPTETFLTDTQVEKRWNVVPGYMSELRAQKTGPPYVRLSPRIIRYTLAEILRYEARVRET
jgi:hypothetical protein